MRYDDFDHKQNLPARRARVTDSTGNGGLALQRPGFRLLDGAMRDAKEQAYREYETMIVNAWRNGVAGAGEGPPDHWRQIDQSSPATAQAETIDQIYAAYDEELSNAWQKS